MTVSSGQREDVLGKKHAVRLSVRNIKKLKLTITEAYLVLPERTDEKAEIRARSETGPVIGLISYEEALDILIE
jgi:hypothetical protein